MTFFYHADSDVLYVTVPPSESSARYVETERGDVLRFSTETDELVGITIPFFEHRNAQGETIAIPESALHLPAIAVLG